MIATRAWLMAALLLGAACAPDRGDAYLASFAAGERAFHAGRYLEAAGAWREAAGRAGRIKDRDEALFLEARAIERTGNWAEARAAYDRLAERSPSGPRGARARFDAANLEIEHGDPARGWALLDEATRRFPQHGLARVSIRRMIRHAHDTGGPAAALAWLDAHEKIFAGTDHEEVLAYERGIALDRAGKKAEGHDVLIASARRHPYPSGGLTDDAFSRAATIDEERGRYEEAIAHLRELLASREPASGGASYERPRYSEAQLRVALIYRDKLHDRAAARREFERLYERHATTINRDDALWNAALLARLDRDADATCKLARRLVSELPESRYASCAHAICEAVPRGKRECADYIMREVRGEKRDEDAPR